MNAVRRCLLPALRELPRTEQETALREARLAGLDVGERLGMAAGLMLVTVITRHVPPEAGCWLRLGAAVLNDVVAVPLLVLFLGPFHLRRLRRGVPQHLAQRPGT